jgi:hypothetical protein
LKLNRYRALDLWWSMIFSENRYPLFRDHALCSMPAFLQRRHDVAAEMTLTTTTMTSSIAGGMVYRLVRGHA